MPDENKFEDEECGRMYAEINQLLNHRFLLTTAAITVFGLFSSWMMPKDPSQAKEIVARVSFSGSFFLQGFLVLLFLWSRFLGNVQSTVRAYLVQKKKSVWQKDWQQYSKKRGAISIGIIQVWVFVVLGLLTMIWPIVICCIYELSLTCAWVLADIGLGIIYVVTVIGFGYCQWMRNTKQIEETWEEVLRPGQPNAQNNVGATGSEG